MGGWKSKFVFLLVIYLAGYATAVYTLAPPPENQTLDESCLSSVPETSEVLQRFNEGLCKCIRFSKEVIKDASWRLGKFIKQKLDERQLQTDP